VVWVFIRVGPMTPEQMKEFRDVARLIANERDWSKVQLFAAELQRLTTLELERQSQIPEAMPAWPCPACGLSLKEHTREMIMECTHKVREGKARETLGL
jgi:hypothetical protein